MIESIWKAKAPEYRFQTLNEDVETDVAIVGGGITGITCAYLLAKAGKKVVVLESRQIGGGTTGCSTGNLYSMIDKRLHHIQSKWDDDIAAAVAESRTAAVDLIERLVKEHGIECSFKRVPWYLFSETNEKDEIIEKETKAAKQYGLQSERLDDLPVPFRVSAALKVEGQAQFNPTAFVVGLAGKVDREKCSIYENSPVHHIEKGDRHVLSTPKGKVTASRVILATHTPKGVYGLQTAIYPYREYAIAARLNSGAFPDGIFWDTEAENHQSMRSFSSDGENYVLVLGGHHKVGQGEHYEKYYERLEATARKNFDVAGIDYRWSGQHYKPADGLPYIGESSDDNIFVATGFSTDGLTYGVLSAMIFDDLFNDRENKWADMYRAKRFTPVKSAKTYIKENINVMGEYLKDLPGKSEAESFEEIKPGEGKVVEKDSEKWAVYKDDKGQVHTVSAVCTHMECIVDWNDAERSWDCPCHGSRFTPKGEVIEGPAFSPLDKKKTNQKEQ